MNALELASWLEHRDMRGITIYDTEAAELLRKQHEAIVKLREALNNYMTGDMIAEGFGSGVGGDYFRHAEQALEATKEFE